MSSIVERPQSARPVFPSFDLLVVQNSLRVIIPVAVDRTEVRIYPIRMKGAPEEILQEHIRYVNLTHSATSLVQTDDIEAFRRAQDVLASEGDEWRCSSRAGAAILYAIIWYVCPLGE